QTMKHFLRFPLLLVLASVFLSSCIKDSCKQTLTYVAYDPVYLTFDELRALGNTEAPRELHQPGKMYFKDGYIFINEVGKGIHVIRNTDPANPENLAFINLPGSHDLAAKGNVLYADSYTDLVAIDITDPTNTSVIEREEDVFPYGSWHNGLYADAEFGVAIDWIETEVTEEVECSAGGFNILPRNGFLMDEAFAVRNFSSNGNQNNQPTSGNEVSTGVGGSLARFTIVNQYLYTVTGTALKVFDIATLENPEYRRDVEIGWGIETIFPYQNTYLMIGSQTGMFVYGLDNPEEPNQLSNFEHARRCDPVVAENDIAYVTLRGGGPCGGFESQLDVIDIKNINNPQLIRSYVMEGPYGLGIRNGVLFVCDGEAGLKVYDAADPEKIDQNQLAHFPDISAFDVIPLYNVLLLIGADGFYQYDYSDLTDIKLLSVIPVEEI
ncbi:MAG: hypothetical protein AAF206_21575, partial [Bacteroidota bacterium]